MLTIELPTDYIYAYRNHTLQVSHVRMDRNPDDYPTRDAYIWALAQDIKLAYKHSILRKTHWVVVTSFEGEHLHSAPGYKEL